MKAKEMNETIYNKLFTNKHVCLRKYVWGDLATRGRVRIFTALNKNNGYERVTEHPERS